MASAGKSDGKVFKLVLVRHGQSVYNESNRFCVSEADRISNHLSIAIDSMFPLPPLLFCDTSHATNMKSNFCCRLLCWPLLRQH